VEFSVRAGGLGKQRTGCIVVGVYEGGSLSPSASRLDEGSRRMVDGIVRRGDLDGELGTQRLVVGVPKSTFERLLLVGLGPEPQFLESSYLTALSCAFEALAETGAADATMCLNELPVNGHDAAWKIERAVVAMSERLYRFDALKSKPRENKPALKRMVFPVDRRAEVSTAEAAIARGVAIAEGVSLARDLGNLPGNICTPSYLAEQARQMGKRHGFTVRILGPAEIARLGMGGFLAVARGTREPPRLIVMEYRGAARKARPVVLVGKGITFDAGGICIKPSLALDEMKFDMCGAASVFGALRAAALMKLPLNVVGIIPATENMPGGSAIKPGDIVTTLSGQTVEVLDTDSEGRVVLCDALTYAEKYDPAAVVDIATLTGAIVTALGDVASGMFSNSDALAREVIAAGESAWDRVWHMPLWNEYQHTLKSNFADLPNIGSNDPDAITGACFLSRFTRRYPWVHLDIAGTASKGGEEKGATGRPVALLAHFLARRAS
jgi:leucyl aminopeptidase